MNDPITKPEHYTSGPTHSECGKPIECIDVSETFTGNVAQAIQYLWRHKLKGTPSQDLRKAAQFALREANRLEGIASWDANPLPASYETSRTTYGPCEACAAPADQCGGVREDKTSNCCVSCWRADGTLHPSVTETTTTLNPKEN